MMEKKITAKKSKAKELKAKTEIPEQTPAPVNNGPPQVNLKTFEFPINSKYVSDNVLYTVIKVHRDSNTEWRTVISAQHGDQDYMLETIRKDIKRDPNFIVVDDGTPSNVKR